MEREIKFRAFDIEYNKMVYPEFSFGFGGLTKGEIIDRYENVIFSTGFKDKNGKEIYEGDIISDLVESDGELIQSKYQVYFDVMTGQFMLDCSAKQDLSFGTSLFQELEDFEYEIIGNIYENSELLSQSKNNIQ